MNRFTGMKEKEKLNSQINTMATSDRQKMTKHLAMDGKLTNNIFLTNLTVCK